LARFELRGIPPMAAGAARIRVTYQVDADGLLNVTASEQTSGVEARIEVKPSYGLSDAEVARMIKDSYLHARDDLEARRLREQKVEASRLIEATESALAEDGGLLNEEELEALVKGLRVLKGAMDGSDWQAIKHAADALNEASIEFAGRRMDYQIRAALAGQKLDSLGV
jgi:molecular chaperone HscA